MVLDRIMLTRSDAPFEMVDPSVHAGFRLSNAGELVALYSAQGIPLDYVDFPALPPGKTYSRVPAGADRWQLADPTPMGMSMAWPPRFSMKTGYLDKPARLTVSAAGPEDVVRYTLDGSDPTPESPVFLGCPGHHAEMHRPRPVLPARRSTERYRNPNVLARAEARCPRAVAGHGPG